MWSQVQILSSRLMSSNLTIPNLLTVARALGIPIFLFFVFREQFLVAVLVLICAGATDYLDGKLARALNQESRLGALLDPAVDRFYIASVLISMYVTAVIPVWVLATILVRDIGLGGILLLLRRAGHPPLPVTYLGKAATFNLLYALPLLLLTENSERFANLAFVLGWAFAGWGIGLYIVTGVQYAIAGLRKLAQEA